MNSRHNWVLLTLVLAALPSLVNLPPWVAGIALAGGVLQYAGRLLPGPITGKIRQAATSLLLVGAVAGIYFGFESWFSGEAVLTFFITVVFLKWAEAKTRRDCLLLIFAAVILAAVGALYWESLLSLLHMVVVIFSLTLSLVAIHTDGAAVGCGLLLRRSGLLLVLGLPLMLLLFLTFPRIQGPLWDVGLAFGLPVKALVNRGAGEFGTEKTLTPGSIEEAARQEGTVLVAQFDGEVPDRDRLYWRGPVFWEFDGETWSLPEGWDNRTELLKKAIRSLDDLEKELRHKGDKVTYNLRVFPNGSRWLYGLDVPAAAAPEAFISDEFQLLSIRKIDDREPRFDMTAYLDYRTGAEITDEQRQRGLAWPEGTNPRLLALGRQLAEVSESPEEIVKAALGHLAGGGYQFDAGYLLDPGKDLLDRFFFDEKRGGAEYMAGSFAMLMRAAGIPARLVSGYRGGTVISLTDFIIVRRADAHAWVEVWRDEAGWQRVETKDVLLSPDAVSGATQISDSTRTAATQDRAAAVIEASAGRAGGAEKTAPETKSDDAEEPQGWRLPDLASIFSGLQKWVIEYDPDRQVELLDGAGIGGDRLHMLLVCIGGVLVLLLTYLAGAWWRGLRLKRVDRVAGSFRGFCRRLEKRHGLKKASRECPRDFLLRVRRERPELAAAADEIIGKYIDIRYGGNDDPATLALFRRRARQLP